MGAGNSAAAAARLHATKLATARRIIDQWRGAPKDWGDAPVALETAAYTDPVRLAAERAALFQQTPIVAGLSCDVAPGAVRLFDETGVPIFLVRDRSGVLRGFLNVCSHRGARLVREDGAAGARLVCRFHGWSFLPDGSLSGVPQKDGFAGCDAAGGLTPVPVAERHGLIFVQASPGSAMDIDGFLGSFAPELAMFELEQAAHVKSGILPVNANWKYVLDTYGEAYHFATLHRDTLAPHFHADVQVYDRFGPHHRIVWGARPMAAWLDQPESDWDVDSMVGWVHYIFPNTILFTGSTQPGRGYVTLFRHFPGATVGETRTYKSIYAPAGVQSEAQRAEIEAAFDATAYVVANEDYVMAAEGWANMQARAPGACVLFGRQEIALQHVHQSLAGAIGYKLPVPAISLAVAAQ